MQLPKPQINYSICHEPVEIETAKTDEFSPREKVQIKAEIERLERLHKGCTDGGIQERIEAWIEAEKKKLPSSDNPE
jgi:hypothetical protein